MDDAAFSQYQPQEIINTKTLEKSTTYGDDANQAIHALRLNQQTLRAALNEAKRREATLAIVHGPDYESFRCAVEDIIRESKGFESHNESVLQRLESMVASVISGRSNDQELELHRPDVSQTIDEARAVWTVALIDYFILSPTLNAGFVEMGFIKIESFGHGGLSFDVDPGMLSCLAIRLRG